jgi:hypothetical protein
VADIEEGHDIYYRIPTKILYFRKIMFGLVTDFGEKSNQLSFRELTGTSSQDSTIRKRATQPDVFCCSVKLSLKDSWQSFALDSLQVAIQA